MKTKTRSVLKIVEEQGKKWQLLKAKGKKEAEVFPVITISREPGSGGRIVATVLAEKIGFDLFHQEIINEMAESAQVSSRVLETLDEKGLSVLEEWITSLVDKRHLWPDQYLRHLMKVIGTIGKHGSAVIVGRGANFVLPPEGRIRVRIVAPLDVRVKMYPAISEFLLKMQNGILSEQNQSAGLLSENILMQILQTPSITILY